MIVIKVYNSNMYGNKIVIIVIVYLYMFISYSHGILLYYDKHEYIQ